MSDEDVQEVVENFRNLKSPLILGYIFVLIPKFVISILTAWYGGQILAHRTDPVAIFLDCTAFVFMTEIDELFYTLLPNTMKQQIKQSLPILSIPASDEDQEAASKMNAIHALLNIMAAFGISAFLFMYWTKRRHAAFEISTFL